MPQEYYYKDPATGEKKSIILKSSATLPEVKKVLRLYRLGLVMRYEEIADDEA